MIAVFAGVGAQVRETPGGARIFPLRGEWEGEDLAQVVDVALGETVLEWSQDPATRGKASLSFTGVDADQFDVLRLQWKYLGGGANITAQIGQRRWYLSKTDYRPGVWRDVWAQLDLDDDLGGALLDEDGRLNVAWHFGNQPQNRPEEERWRRIRVRNPMLVRFPVRLDCDPQAVRYEADEAELRTIYPLRLENRTAQAREVRLFLDPAALRDFTTAFAAERVTVPAGETLTVNLTFRIGREAAAAREPLSIEEAPVYAVIDDDPLTLTTWYRAYVQWRPGGVIPPRRTQRPLMLPPGTAERVRRLAAEDPRAAEVLARLTNVTAALDRPLLIPELRHGYSGSNVCPEHQKPVRFSEDEFRRHWCPAGEHWVEGVEHLDRASALSRHTLNGNDCKTLGYAWYFTGDEAAARKAANILLEYAEHYPDWDYRNAAAVGYWSRVAHAVLGECWWIHNFVTGYDCIAAWPGLSAAEHTRIRRFFGVAAESIQSHRIAANQQCEINAASGGAAINAENWFLAARAHDGDYGWRDQVELAFSEEGFSRENEFPYHFSAMLPIVHQALAWEALGANVFDTRLKRIFDAPLAFSINQRLGWADMYAVAYARYRDPDYRRQVGDQAALLFRLLYGGWELPPVAEATRLRNSSLALAGKSVLRAGTPDDLRAAQLSWGAPTYRGGQDMLNVLLHFKGADLNRSVTRIGYGYNVPGLSYTTLAGNLPIVDGLVQTGVRPVEEIIRDGEFPVARYRAPVSAPVYPGVDLTRTVAIVGDAFVIIDRLAAGEPRRFEFSFYPAADELTFVGVGDWEAYPAFDGEGVQYDRVQNVHRAVAGRRMTVDYVVGGTNCRLHILSDGEGSLLRGQAHTGWHPFLTPVLLHRREASAPVTVMVLEAGRPELPLTAVELVEAGDSVVVELRGPGGAWRIEDAADDVIVTTLENP